MQCRPHNNNAQVDPKELICLDCSPVLNDNNNNNNDRQLTINFSNNKRIIVNIKMI